MAAIDTRLYDFCTKRQREYLEAWNEHGSAGLAAVALGAAKSAVTQAHAAVKKKAAQQGYAPDYGMIREAPQGFHVKGVSTLYDREGHQAAQWVKTSADAVSMREALEDARAALLEDIPPYNAEPFLLPTPDSDIIPWIQIGDAHLGMVAYMRETGHNFDLEIGAAEFREAFRYLLDKCDPGERCVINDLGDATHYENFKAETERGGHKLDADTRFPKMIQVYTRLMREVIELALTKFRYVDVITNQGNHSRTNDIWMREYTRLFGELIDARYGGTGRVNSISNESVFVGYRMGKTFVMTHHSDKCSGEKLADVLFKDFIDDVKHCEFFYVDTGHVHHSFVKKERGIVEIESWNNLAPNDKHHHDAGYRSKQSMTVVYRSRTYGQIGRHTVPIQMVWDRLAKAGGVKTSAPLRSRAFVV